MGGQPSTVHSRHQLGLSFPIADGVVPPASPAQIPEAGGHRLLNGARTLHFPRLGEADSGLYSCRAENQAGKAQRDFSLLVLGEWPQHALVLLYRAAMKDLSLSSQSLQSRAFVRQMQSTRC